MDDVSRAAAAAAGNGRVVFFPADLRSPTEISALFQSIQSYDFGPGEDDEPRPLFSGERETEVDARVIAEQTCHLKTEGAHRPGRLPLPMLVVGLV